MGTRQVTKSHGDSPSHEVTLWGFTKCRHLCGAFRASCGDSLSVEALRCVSQRPMRSCGDSPSDEGPLWGFAKCRHSCGACGDSPSVEANHDAKEVLMARVSVSFIIGGSLQYYVVGARCVNDPSITLDVGLDVGSM